MSLISRHVIAIETHDSCQQLEESFLEAAQVTSYTEFLFVPATSVAENLEIIALF